MAIELKGDFIGFSFNGYRSEDLGIVRVSDGSRYNEDLLPTAQDKTVQVPGGDGFYYFGSDYTQKPLTIPIAFDNLSEEDFSRLSRVFGTKDLGPLIFDERPYKYYMAKANKPQLKYICFEEKGKGRVYKGEGTLTFTCYYPFGKSVYKFLNEYGLGEEVIPDWYAASRIKSSQGNYDKVLTDGSILVYNAGDLEADFILEIGSTTNAANVTIPNFDITLTTSDGIVNSTLGILKFRSFTLQDGENSFQINTKTNLIEGLKDGALTGRLYNKHLIGGDFFKIPADTKDYKIQINSSGNVSLKGISYNYIYY